MKWYPEHFLWSWFKVSATESQVNNGSGNDLVPSDNKPLPEPMLNQIYGAIWHHKATMRYLPPDKVKYQGSFQYNDDLSKARYY